MEHKTRKIVHTAVTTNSTDEWTAQQLMSPHLGASDQNIWFEITTANSGRNSKLWPRVPVLKSWRRPSRLRKPMPSVNNWLAQWSENVWTILSLWTKINSNASSLNLLTTIITIARTKASIEWIPLSSVNHDWNFRTGPREKWWPPHSWTAYITAKLTLYAD